MGKFTSYYPTCRENISPSAEKTSFRPFELQVRVVSSVTVPLQLCFVLKAKWIHGWASFLWSCDYSFQLV